MMPHLSRFVQHVLSPGYTKVPNPSQEFFALTKKPVRLFWIFLGQVL